MISKFAHMEELFGDVGKTLQCDVKAYVIGGAVLLEQGMKTATKDIDMVVSTGEEFACLRAALKSLGFRGQIPEKEYARMNLSQIFEKGDFRIDLFLLQVCGKFSLSDGMMARAKKKAAFGRLELFFCSNEDVFLFKTMTEREGDLEDCMKLAASGLDWKVILSELKGQVRTSRRDVWVTWVGERLEILEERGLVIPIMKDIGRLRDRFFADMEKKLKI
jgi:hypothetical protein